MKKYKVHISAINYYEIDDIEAENINEAEEKAVQIFFTDESKIKIIDCEIIDVFAEKI